VATAVRPRRAFVPTLLAVLVAIGTAGSAVAESTSINAAVQVMPLEIRLDLSTAQARIGETVRAKATVTNVGPSKVSAITVELRLDATAVVVRGTLVGTISKLQPGKSASLSWSLCPTRAGNDLILARASLGGASIESEARLLTVAGQQKRGC
jgi:hypothetical protein